MARAIAAIGVLIGIFALAWGAFWLADPPAESFGVPVAVVLLAFSGVGVYSGLSVLRSGRL
jgi:hypothetical protein